MSDDDESIDNFIASDDSDGDAGSDVVEETPDKKKKVHTLFITR